MNLATVLSVFVIIPGVIWILNRTWLANRFGRASLAALSALLAYVFIVLVAAYVDFKLEANLAEFDLNGDGFFSGAEITPEQQQAMQLVVADTGRTFAPITGAVFSVIYFLSLWLLLSMIALAKKLRKKWLGRRQDKR